MRWRLRHLRQLRFRRRQACRETVRYHTESVEANHQEIDRFVLFSPIFRFSMNGLLRRWIKRKEKLRTIAVAR